MKTKQPQSREVSLFKQVVFIQLFLLCVLLCMDSPSEAVDSATVFSSYSASSSLNRLSQSSIKHEHIKGVHPQNLWVDFRI